MLELLEALRADQFDRWRSGERVEAETYLDRNPTLRDDPEAAVDLIYSEILLREELGEVVAVEEYLRRFPRYAVALERQLQLHDLFRPDLLGGPLADNPTTPYRRGADLRIPADRERTLPLKDVTGAAPAGLPADDPARWPALPGFVIEGKLGSGGGGVVYRARQLSLDRTVAVKVLHPLELPEPEELALFRNEAAAVARLHHPHVVQIHEFGEHEGWPYFVMEYLPGGGLDRRFATGPMTATDAATLVATLAEAVHAVHEHGIIHRDLKPANILLDGAGVPKVADFGLAKRLGVEQSLIKTGTVAGTPAYMAPEQACGRSKAVGPATDVYSLGAILYEALTGSKPFPGKSVLDVLEQVKSRSPVAPRRLRRTVPRDLEVVCLKCLEKEPGRRYASAAALAGDLRRFLNRERIEARPERWPARLLRPVRRRWLVAGLALLVAAATGLSLAGYLATPEDPEKTMERSLARDGSYTFVAAGGQPKVIRWPANAGIIDNPTDTTGGFAFESLSFCPLELVSQPHRDSYRFRVKVRHDRANHQSSVGIFFGLTNLNTATGEVLNCCVVSFNDLEDLARPDPGIHLNPVCLRVQLYGETASIRKTRNAGPCATFVPARAPARQGPWRELAIEVTPAKVRVFWEAQLFNELTPDELSALGRSLRDAAPRLAGVDAEFHPNGGFGLFVENGSASFKDVVVETLPAK